MAKKSDKPLSKTEILNALAEATGHSRKEVGGMIDALEAKSFKPNVVILDANNAIVDADYIEKHGEVK